VRWLVALWHLLGYFWTSEMGAKSIAGGGTFGNKGRWRSSDTEVADSFAFEGAVPRPT